MTAGADLPLESLPRAWNSLMERIGAAGDTARCGRRLLDEYAAQSRAYHDVRHLAEVVARVEELAEWAVDLDAVRAAAWFHDAIYDPSRGDNEEQSALLAERELAMLGVAGGFVAEVVRLVRLTATHAPTDNDRNGMVLCDADLAILAADADRYHEYAGAVRREYRRLSDDRFRSGRTEVLNSLLARPRLYGTPPARRWEQAARRNMERERERLLN